MKQQRTLPQVWIKKVRLTFESFCQAEFTLKVAGFKFKVQKINGAFEFPKSFEVDSRLRDFITDLLQKAYIKECKAELEVTV